MEKCKTEYTWNEMLLVPVEELPERSRVPIKIFDQASDMFYDLARRVVDAVKSNNAKGLKTRIAWPVGPKKNYPLMVEMTKQENVSWKNPIIEEYEVEDAIEQKVLEFPGIQEITVLYARKEAETENRDSAQSQELTISVYLE